VKLTHVALAVRDVDRAVKFYRHVFGAVEEQGEFVPGAPYRFATDPDGYELEIWYELPTPVDPKTR